MRIMKVAHMVGGVFVVLVGLLAIPYVLSLTVDMSSITPSLLMRALPVLILGAAIMFLVKVFKK